MLIANTEVDTLWDFKKMAEAVKNGAKREDFAPLETNVSSLKNVLNKQILECRGRPPSAEQGGAYGCAHKQDVIVLIGNNIINPCYGEDEVDGSDFHPLTVAREQYAKSMELGKSFDFESWEKVCTFTRSDITDAPKKINDEL